MVDKDEQLSALIDSELKDEQALQALVCDEQGSQKWQRYHLVGDIMRGSDLPSSLNLDLSDSIAKALEQEASYNASMPANDSGVEQTTEQVGWLKQLPVANWFKGVGQYAIAASVAVMAILGVQHYQQAQSQPTNASQPLQVLDTVPIGGTVAPVSLQTHFSDNPDKLTEKQWLEQRKEIAAFLQDHQLQQRQEN
ncbi:sigma-E factor negative regulatory protein [Celerinatantimonas sp. MCCC 1A17872]|uniref:sigma-E factor negative regulatory protein n=1 Tax=Celerinatantimonas sp. MCCC 1A17872 TaxID=3177514 RepID=UPI0038C4A2E6